MEQNDLALQKLMAEAEKRRKTESAKQFWHVFFGRGIYSKICFGILVLFVLVSVLCPLLAQYSPYKQDLLRALEGLHSLQDTAIRKQDANPVGRTWLFGFRTTSWHACVHAE